MGWGLCYLASLQPWAAMPRLSLVRLTCQAAGPQARAACAQTHKESSTQVSSWGPIALMEPQGTPLCGLPCSP